jgi:gas vesicle protein
MPVFSHQDFKKYVEVVAKRGQALQKIGKRRAEIAKTMAKLADLHKDLISEMEEYNESINRQVDQMRKFHREKLSDFDSQDIDKLLRKKTDIEKEIQKYDAFKESLKNLAQTTERYANDIQKEADLILTYCKNRIRFLELDEELIDKIEKLESEKVREKIKTKKDEIESENNRKKAEIIRQEEVVQNDRMDSISEWRALKNVINEMS